MRPAGVALVAEAVVAAIVRFAAIGSTAGVVGRVLLPAGMALGMRPPLEEATPAPVALETTWPPEAAPIQQPDREVVQQCVPGRQVTPAEESDS